MSDKETKDIVSEVLGNNNSSPETTPNIQHTKSKGRLNTTQRILIIGFALILMGGGVFAYFMLREKPQPVTDKGGNFVIDKDNLGNVVDLMESKVNEGMFECNMNTTWNFKSSKLASEDAYVANANTNHKPIYFEVIRDDNKEVLYKSTIIPVGNRIKEIKLNKELSKGVYDTTCVYHLMDEQSDGTYKEYSSASFALKLNIES